MHCGRMRRVSCTPKKTADVLVSPAERNEDGHSSRKDHSENEVGPVRWGAARNNQLARYLRFHSLTSRVTHKFLEKLSEFQPSVTKLATRRTGMEMALL